MIGKLAKAVDAALDPRNSMREREAAIRALNEVYGRMAVTAQLRKATRKAGR